jgi:crotonobetainyl-CoA:carnitine CoA-transferase CaiB-like acyl-CoA transferase
MQIPSQRTGPLAGLKVLEIGHYIAAPFCTRILADLGAEVIKVEPPGGDPFRGWGASVDGHSVWFSVHGRNKLSVVLDLKRDRDVMLRLASRADVLVENLRAGGLERLNLSPEALHAVNSRLVIARISGYGQDGPYRDKPAFGAIGEAMGGIRHLTAHPSGSSDLPPPRCGISISDDLAGLYAAIGLLSALWQRDVAGTARGRVVDVNLVDSVFSLMEGMLPEYAMDGRVRQPVGAAIETAAPTNTYPCADGRWLCIAGNSDLIFSRLMAAIGRPDLARDPAYATNADRCARRMELDAAIATWDADTAGEGRRGAAGGCGRAVLAALRHRRLRQRSAFSGPRFGAGGDRPADRANAASGSCDPARRRKAGGRGGLARPSGRRAHRICADRAAWHAREVWLISAGRGEPCCLTQPPLHIRLSAHPELQFPGRGP